MEGMRILKRVRSFVGLVDKRLLGSFLVNWRSRIGAKKAEDGLRKRAELVTLTLKFGSTGLDVRELSELCDRYGSDKGSLGFSPTPFAWLPHTYTHHYGQILSTRRDKVHLVLEYGIGTNNPEIPSSMGVGGRPGASLRVWRDYFPKARVYGADIDRDCLFNEDRITTYFVDQTSPDTFDEMWEQIGDLKFDLIVDDGLHTTDAAVTTLQKSLDHLASNGIYIIEDLSTSEIYEVISAFSELNFEARIMPSGSPFGARNNLLIVHL